MRGVIGGCSWPPLTRSRRGEEEDEQKAHRGPAGDKVKHLQQEDDASLESLTESGLRTPQCRICFQGPDKWQSISLNLIEKIQISAIILGALFLTASFGWLMWSIVSPYAEFQHQDYIFKILYGLYIFMDFVCIGLLIQQGPAVYRIIRRWHTMNQKWKVLNYEKKKDLTSCASKGAGGEENTREVTENGQEPRRRLRSCLTLYVGNTVLRILNRLRPNNLTANHEVVMSATTV
ncbi:E3 ubiquitin-protein ligase MARCHF9-like isoform X3 [Phyllopteryx taeniolatus]|uniref:E3 ubiquitin-protein ligase MARCHF9-like isoform X3 n=1 Tax=Phyllopteryx taeniolatus TaxID=161469 RepID=UPI002AD4D32C|nr:E3 ubiquitin-protein ligase MARCHF9-like isoform X3 [Phyllopteryx taeniolatus]